MSYEQKAEDYHINKVCDIEEEIRVLKKGCIGRNSYLIARNYTENDYMLIVNGNQFDCSFGSEYEVEEMINNLEEYERLIG